MQFVMIVISNHLRNRFFSRPDVDLFGAIKKTGKKTTIFYDSVCGLPLFEAPKNRTFEEFQTESNNTIGLVFKDEIIGDNVKILKLES